MEEAGQLIEVVAEEVGPVVFEDLGEDFAELEELHGEGAFGRRGQGQVAGGRWVRSGSVGTWRLSLRGTDGVVSSSFSLPGFAKDALDADVAVLQVGRGVAGEGEHFVPGKGVVALAVGEEVGVFDGAEADDAGDLAALSFGEGGVFLGDDGEGALFGFVEEVGEPDGVAAAGFEGATVGAEDGAEPDVLEPGGGGGLPAVEDGEELAEVVLLAAVGDVEDGVGRIGALAVVERGEVWWWSWRRRRLFARGRGGGPTGRRVR